MAHGDNPVELLPDRRETDIPPNVQWFLSVCETAIAWYRYQKLHDGEPQERFCCGVVDYWHKSVEEVEEPTFEMLFQRPLTDKSWDGYPSYKRFCYQQGAIVGYQLRQQYDAN